MRTGWNAEETCRYFVEYGKSNESISHTEKIAVLESTLKNSGVSKGAQIKIQTPIKCQIKIMRQNKIVELNCAQSISIQHDTRRNAHTRAIRTRCNAPTPNGTSSFDITKRCRPIAAR
jgi:hypothetical protein